MKALILCYHKVGPNDEEGRRLNVEPRRLETHIRYYARRRIPHLVASAFSQPRSCRGICFTFDDAYESTLRNALPLLDRNGFKGTFYVVSAKAGATSDWDRPHDRPLAGLELLRTAASAGHEIGNHTRTHPRLCDLSPEEQETEIAGAHRDLAEAGLEPRTLCYPFGAFDADSIRIARDTGYRVGMSLKKGVIDDNPDPLSLPRVVVAFSDTLPMLIYKTRVKPIVRGLRGR